MSTPPLPIDAHLPQVCRVLSAHGTALLSAPPGTGKTTRVPPALAGGGGSVVVLEPRRLAARAAARRVAAELGCEVGDRVGYQVRNDRRVSASTAIQFVTEGVLVRRLLADPYLAGVATVCLDEFHERHLEGDLALAMLAEVRETVRPDLQLLVMSATLDLEPLRRFLPGCGEVVAEGRLFPVTTEHEPRPDDRPLELRVRAAVTAALARTAGDVLVFLPGVGEIERAAAALQGLAGRGGCQVVPLHGGLDAESQDRALRPQAQRKVVLSTNVAESSVTIDGVTAVVDSGLARVLRHDRGRGLDVLRVERISLASADQRRGRAGRTGPGLCLRLWTAGEERGFPSTETAEIRRVDLTGPVLQVRAFAGRDPRQFGWFEAPDEAALARADRLLVDLGAIGDGGRLTAAGRRMLALPLHPRLARVVQRGREEGCPRLAAAAVALVAEGDRRRRDAGADLVELCHAFLHAEQRGFSPATCRELGLSPSAARAIARVRDRLGRRAGAAEDDDGLARAVLAGFPDRVARRREKGAPAALMVGGQALELPDAAVPDAELVVAVDVLETGTRRRRAGVGVLCAIEPDWLDAVVPGSLRREVLAVLQEATGRVVAVNRQCYRDLVLVESRGGEVPAERSAELLAPLLAVDPWRWLGEQKDLRRLLARSRWLRGQQPELGLPEWSDRELAAAAAGLLSGSDLRVLRDARIGDLLLAGLSSQQRRALDRLAPDRLALPSGRRAVVDYSAPAGPTVAARIQELFGLVATPGVGGVAVVLELLAPNQRPVQVTRDLLSFWNAIYPGVRRELSRRYPRHAWPEDPMTAAPEARPARRRPR